MMKKLTAFLLFVFVVRPGVGAFTCNAAHEYHAVYDANVYNCEIGYYLPANTDGCRPCPSGFVCPGGIFVFNQNLYQGLEIGAITNGVLNNVCASNLPHELIAVYEPNVHTCNPGYYMPANTDGCVVCPAGYYCPGGTYTYSETTTQGITACGAGLYSPAGMWESAQCGHILHVGDASVYLRATKKTTPSVHIKIGNDIFYGNMTTADVVMNSGTAHKLKLNYNGTIYSVYDDTINP